MYGCDVAIVPCYCANYSPFASFLGSFMFIIFFMWLIYIELAWWGVRECLCEVGYLCVCVLALCVCVFKTMSHTTARSQATQPGQEEASCSELNPVLWMDVKARQSLFSVKRISSLYTHFLPSCKNSSFNIHRCLCVHCTEVLKG